MAPLLSICLPTYNRARLLEDALNSLVPQVAAAGDEVELVISDNGSTDDTAAVVERARRLGPFRYYRNESNVGFARNILRLTDELATGEFAWFQCDDDMTCPGGVQRVLTVLKSHRDLDFIFVNVAPRNESTRRAISSSIEAGDVPPLFPAKCADKVSRHVESFSVFIDQKYDEVFLGSVMCWVFRLSRWRQYRLNLVERETNQATLYEVYPHIVMLAKTMVGANSFYLAEPCTFTFWGGQSWKGLVPFIVLVLLHEGLDAYEASGVESWRIAKCRRRLLMASARSLRLMLFDSKTLERSRFSLRAFLTRHKRHSATLCLLPVKMAADWTIDMVPSKIKDMIKRVIRRESAR
jgi:glycosyltransferase involved in cell wall biosynthesis